MSLTTKQFATIRHLTAQIQIELARAAAYSAAGKLENARGCLERADNCNDRIYCIETGEDTTEEM